MNSRHDPPEDEAGRIEIEALRLEARGLRRAGFATRDAAERECVLRRWGELEVEIAKREAETASTPKPVEAETHPTPSKLGPETTGLEVAVHVRMSVLPTGIYHLFDPETQPLAEVSVTNASRKAGEKPRRVCVRSHIEGLSAEEYQSREIPRGETATFKLLPPIKPSERRKLTQVGRCSLFIEVTDLDNKVESRETYSMVHLAESSGVNAVRDPVTRKWIDMTKYYGAWVTPHVDPIQRIARAAAGRVPDRMIYGYQKGKDHVEKQVEALYDELKAQGLVYVDTAIDFGAADYQTTQRVRLPRESLRLKSANCIDGTVLFASLLESVGLRAALVIVPGHAVAGWWDDPRGKGNPRFLETTLVGTADFAAAVESGKSLVESLQKQEKLDNLPRVTIHDLIQLRAARIWPME